VRRLFITLLGALVAASRLIAATNPAPAAASQATDPVQKEFKRLMEADDNAQAEVDQWILDNNAAAARGAAASKADLQHRIRERFAPIRKGYEEFLRRHPDYAPGYVAYGSFLHDMHDSDGARVQWEKALALNPKDPAAYNNLANLYSHTGPMKKAFDYYAKAIELNPREPLYYQNLGDAVFVFRKDAMEHYGLTEQQVYNKALDLYRQALKLDPDNFPLASEVAQTYYGIKPLRLEDALQAWTNALALAHDDTERQGVCIHFARLKLQADRFAEVRAHLRAVTNEMYAVLKQRLVRNLEKAESEAKDTNAPLTVPSRESERPREP
jgi:tetratricopeptide (TPR) repeat protein